jgi:hypothetical protein
MDEQTLRELILGELAVHAEGAIELAYRLDQDPRDVLRVLEALAQEERVVHAPREGWEWRVVE